MSIKHVLAVAAVVVLILGGFGYYRWHRWYFDPVRSEQIKSQTQDKALFEARKKDFERARERSQKSAQAAQAAEISEENAFNELVESMLGRKSYALSPKQRFPLQASPTILSEAVALPQADKPAPALFFAPLSGAKDEPSSTTLALEYMLRFALRPARPGHVPLNLVPFNYMEVPYMRADNSQPVYGRKPEEYLRDAERMGAHVLVHGRADSLQEKIAFSLAMTDLRTSQSDTWQMAVAPEQLAEALRAGATKIATFAGVKPEELACFDLSAETLPNGAALQCALAPEADSRDTTAARTAIAAAAPNCPWLHDWHMQSAQGDDAVELANEALSRWPDDPRLLYTKAQTLRASREYTASHALMSEFVRRQPNSLLGAAQLRLSLRAILLNNEWSPILGSGYRGALEQIDQLLALYPDNWALRWDRATCSGNTFLRCTGLVVQDMAKVTSDPKSLGREQWIEMSKRYAPFAEQTVTDLRRARERRPDCPGLIVDLLYWHDKLTDGEGEDDPQVAWRWQSPLLAQMALLDPKNIDADLIVASQQAETTESQQVRILREAAERCAKDPKVMIRIASNILDRLVWRTEWYDGMPHEELEVNARRLIDLPETDLFCEALLAGVAANEFVWPRQAYFAWYISKLMPKHAHVHGKVYEYKNSHWKAANAAIKKGDWATCLEHARRAVWLLGDKEREWMQYCVVKSLWKLGRLRESIYESEMGIYNFPKKHTFHYMFAVVALELDDRLEEAYERAKIAVELDPQNQGIHETVAKLGKKLGKL